MKRCFQTLLGALDSQRTLLCDVDKIKEQIRALDGKEEEIHWDDVYTEEQMCKEAHIGRPAFQKIKALVNNEKKQNKKELQFDLPEPCCKKPLKYKRYVVEKFIEEVDRYRRDKKSKKKKK